MDTQQLEAYLVVLAIGTLFGGAAGLRWPLWRTPVFVFVLTGFLPLGLIFGWTASLAALGALGKVVLVGTTGQSESFSAKFEEYFRGMLNEVSADFWIKQGGLMIVAAAVCALTVWLRRRRAGTATMEE